jgi:hypothetical protein
LIGILVALPLGWVALLASSGAVWIVAWSLKWRAAFTALFIFLPVAAVPGILLQQQGWPTLLNDGLFLLPAYVGLGMAVLLRRTSRWPLRASLTIPLAGLTLLVLLQALRVLPTYPLVALIGLKTWLLYLPFLLVPAAVFTSTAQVRRFMRVLALVSMVPSIAAVVQFGFILTGHQDVAYQWYGALGSDVSQNFTQVSVADQIAVYRIPSTFTFFTQFVAYCLITTPICITIWMSDPHPRWRRLAAVASVLIVAAGFASGSRTFYVWGPIEICLMLLLMNRGRMKLLAMLVIAGGVSVIVAGSQLFQVATHIATLGWDYMTRVNAAEFSTVYQLAGLLGVGAGLDTNASRYVLPSHALPYGIEGWYALTFLELGLPGLILVLVVCSVLLRDAWLGVRKTRGSVDAPIAVGCFVILLSTTITLYKGVSLEYEPLNIYFWAVAGLALVMPRLARESDRSDVIAVVPGRHAGSLATYTMAAPRHGFRGQAESHR